MYKIWFGDRVVNRVPGPGKTTRTWVSNYPKATRKFIRDKLFRRRNCEKEFLQDDSKHKPKHQGQDGGVLQ